MELIERGASGPEVKRIQEMLKGQGWYFDGDPRGNFGPLTEDAVEDFQFTHLNEKGLWLESDGVVGPETMWALENPDGDAQKSFLNATIPNGIGGARLKTLKTALKYWQRGVHESPSGANSGDGVDQFVRGYNKPPWCALFVSHVDLEANGSYAIGKREAGTANMLRKAREQGIFLPKGEYDPIPGDWFIMQNKRKDGTYKGTGHVGFVLRVSADGRVYQTVEGNCGNRVKCGERLVSSSKLEGWIRRYSDTQRPPSYVRGLAERFSKGVSGASTR